MVVVDGRNIKHSTSLFQRDRSAYLNDNGFVKQSHQRPTHELFFRVNDTKNLILFVIAKQPTTGVFFACGFKRVIPQSMPHLEHSHDFPSGCIKNKGNLDNFVFLISLGVEPASHRTKSRGVEHCATKQADCYWRF